MSPRFLSTSHLSVSSNVQSIGFPVLAKHSVGQILESLTLPRLQSFAFQPRSDQGPLPMWHAEHFLKLAERSSFHSHLTRLEITVVMTDEALLGCLTVLPLLAELAISDGTPSREHIFSFLITGALLQGTQISDETALIPALEVLCLRSLLRFDDSVYLQLVVSRLKEDFDNPFETYLEWLPGHQRDSAGSCWRNILTTNEASGSIVVQRG
ncbi:hypothetical protein B0H13DRAFT_2413408 [Mycena leptocephala]|nr:hypothetical protein B0H13DRAFT_2413408 [Mycena leptocephala]